MASQGTPGFQPAPTAQLSGNPFDVASILLPPSNTGIETPGVQRSPFPVPTFIPTLATTSITAISGCTSPPIQQVEHIIPDEDPQRPFDLGDDDNDDEGDRDWE